MFIYAWRCIWKRDLKQVAQIAIELKCAFAELLEKGLDVSTFHVLQYQVERVLIQIHCHRMHDILVV